MPINFLKKPSWLIAILIVTAIKFCGAARFTDLASIPFFGLGRLYIHDLYLLLLITIMLWRFLLGRNESLRSAIGYPLGAFLLLTAFQAIRSFWEGSDPHYILNHMRPLVFYFSYFLILGFFRCKEDLSEFIKLLALIAIISAAVVYFQTITGKLNLASKIEFRADYFIYQTLNVSMFLMACVFLMLFSISVGKREDIKFVLNTKLTLFWIGGALLLTLVRSLWISTLVGISIIIMLSGIRIRKAIIIVFLLFIALIIVINVIEYLADTASFSFIISDRLLSAYQDVKEMSGSFEDRMEMMRVRWDYMLENNPLWGQGFKGTAYDLLPGYKGGRAAKLDPTLITGHNIVGDLAVLSGLSGFFVLGWLLVVVFRKAIHLLKTLPPSWQKSLACGLLAFNIQAVLISYTGDSLYLKTAGSIVLASSWAILELIGRFYIPEDKKTLEGRREVE